MGAAFRRQQTIGYDELLVFHRNARDREPVALRRFQACADADEHLLVPIDGLYIEALGHEGAGGAVAFVAADAHVLGERGSVADHELEYTGPKRVGRLPGRGWTREVRWRR